MKNQGGGASPRTPSPPPQTKVTIAGKNEIYNRENLVRPFLGHQVLGPNPPPPPAQKEALPAPPTPDRPARLPRQINAVAGSGDCTEVDAKVLKACLKPLLELLKYPQTADCALATLDHGRLDLFLQVHVPAESGLYLMGAEVCKALAARSTLRLDPRDRSPAVVVECVRHRLRSSSVLSSSSRSASTSIDTSHDLSTSVYESLSSDSSVPSSPFDIARLTLSFDADPDADTEDLFSLASDGPASPFNHSL